MTLEAALEELRAQGIETLYTSRLIRGEMQVAHLPPAGTAADRLRNPLGQYGLEARATEDGRWVVVPQRTATLEGTVISRPGGDPISGSRLEIVGSDTNVHTDAAGRFRWLRVPAGLQTIQVTRPGYVDREIEVLVTPGIRRLEVAMVVDSRASDEIFVSTTPQVPPLGVWHMRAARQESTSLVEQDLLTGISRLPGVRSEREAAFGIRGGESNRVTLVVDGLEIVEPYHFRDLGSLSGTVTPSAVAEVRLYRGAPPLEFGDRAGGVIEMVTESAASRFSGRLTVGSEAAHAALDGSLLGDRWRWLVAYREDEPDLPTEIGEVDSLPFYWDGVIKISAVLSPRHDASLRVLKVYDEFSFLDQLTFPHLVASGQTLVANQDSHHAGLRYVASLGRRHVVEALLSDIEVDRTRRGYEADAEIPMPRDAPPHRDLYLIEDLRHTERQGQRVQVISSLSEHLDIRWGLDSSRESTAHDYTDDVGFLSDPQDSSSRQTRYTQLLRQQRKSAFALAKWRPRADLTFEAGLRWDDEDLDGHSTSAPRVAVSHRLGDGVLRAAWARVRTSSRTHELLLADGEDTLPGSELIDYSAVGYELDRSRHRLSIEIYDQQIDDPRLRFDNLYKPISRFPEIEIDRRKVQAESARNQGVEVRWQFSARRWQAATTYELSRSEDRLEGRWVPKRSDHRHRLHVDLAFQLPLDLQANVLWWGHSGNPTTPFYIDRIGSGFGSAVGEVNSARQPPEHRLDLRLRRPWQCRGIRWTAEIGVDNLYDRKPIRGYDLLALQDPQALPTELPVELGLGRRFRWGLELRW